MSDKDFYKKKIKPQLDDLTKCLRVDVIQQKLLQKGLINEDDDQVLRVERQTQRQRAKYFLNDLLSQWDAASYSTFCEIILESAESCPAHRKFAELLDIQKSPAVDVQGASSAKSMQSPKYAYGSSAGKHDKTDSRDEVDGQREKKIGPASVPVEVLQDVLKAATAVCFIKDTKGRATGFLVGQDLVFTNNHVIPDRASAKQATFTFNYTDSSARADRPEFKFKSVGGLFVTDARLDFSLIQLQSKSNSLPVVDLAAAELPDTMSRISMLKAVKDPSFLSSETGVYILHHPDGNPTSVSPHGTLKDVPGNGKLKRLFYSVSTQPASSGSPVFNEAAKLIGIHCCSTKGEANEGVFIGAVIQDLKSKVENYLGFGDGTGEKETLKSFLSSFGESVKGPDDGHL